MMTNGRRLAGSCNVIKSKSQTRHVRAGRRSLAADSEE
jgi:hypothetical protein